MRKQKRHLRQQKKNAENERLANIRKQQLEKARSGSLIPPSEQNLIARPVQARVAPPPRTAPQTPGNRYGRVLEQIRGREERRSVSPPLPLLMILSRAPTYSASPSYGHPAQRGKRGGNRRGNGKGRQLNPPASLSAPITTNPTILQFCSPYTSTTRVESSVEARKGYKESEGEWKITIPFRLKNPTRGNLERDIIREEQTTYLAPSEGLLGVAVRTLPPTLTPEIENPEQTIFAKVPIEEASKTPLPTIPPPVVLAATPGKAMEKRQAFDEKGLNEQRDIVLCNLQDWHRARVNSLGARTRELEGDIERVLRRARSL